MARASVLANTIAAHLAQQAAFEVGAAAARVRDEAPGVRRRRPGQRLQLKSRHGTRRRSGTRGWRGWSGRTREGARGQDAGGGLHAGGASQHRLGSFSVPPRRDRACHCLDLLRCARAGGSPAFLSMNACPLPGVTSLRARPLPGGRSPRNHAPPQPYVIEKLLLPANAPRGSASFSGLKGAAVLLGSVQIPPRCRRQPFLRPYPNTLWRLEAHFFPDPSGFML